MMKHLDPVGRKLSLASGGSTLPLGVAFGLMVALSAGIVAAQSALTPYIYLPGLTQDDIDRLHAAADKLYEGQSVGTVERWRSPESQDSGELKLIRSFDANGIPCRTIDYTILIEGTAAPYDYVINWCRVPGGTWRIVQDVQPRRGRMNFAGRRRGLILGVGPKASSQVESSADHEPGEVGYRSTMSR